ncbi:MAG: hypothetical protein AB1454_03985 [Candidatus Auribacterota bacterium]
MDNTPATAVIEKMSGKLANIEPGTLRYQTLETALNFKATWISLGEKLHEVFKSEDFKKWGYKSFERYCSQEIGIQKKTAEKLTTSYYFLKVHEPKLISEYKENKIKKEIPDVNTIHMLANVKDDENVTEDKYNEFKQAVFEEGCTDRQLKKRYNDFISTIDRADDETDMSSPEQDEKLLATFIQALERLDRKADDIISIPVEIKTDLRKLLVRLKSLV